MIITEKEWEDSQQHEANYWRGQLTDGNKEQYHRWGWYTNTCFPSYFKTKNFRGLCIADVGSGPRGVLHYINAKGKVAIDPLMHDFVDYGHGVSDNSVIAVQAKIENVASIFYRQFDVVFNLNCLDHCKDPSLGIDQLAKTIKPGGELVICVDMRHPEDLDNLHKIRITNDFMINELHKNRMVFVSWHVPHQPPTRTIQFCAIAKKVE